MTGAVETMMRRGRIARASRVLAGRVVLSGALLVAAWGIGCGSSEPAPSLAVPKQAIPSTPARPADFVAASGEPALGSPPRRDFRPGDYAGYNLIVISVDTLRADHLGLYGYQRKTSPAIDRIGDESIVFNRAQVPRGLTWPSLVAFFTSLYPITSNVRDNGDLLSDDIPTLSKTLAAEGYRTAAFLSNSCGALQGPYDVLYCGQPDAVVNQQALRWVAEKAPSLESPFFLWVHYWGPHAEYAPAPEFNVFVDANYHGPANGGREYLAEVTVAKRSLSPADHQQVVALYDGAVLATDHLIGLLWQALSQHNLLDRSIVVLTSDHGEELGQHAGYYYHACSIYDAVLHVPMLIRLPGGRRASLRVPQIIESLDVMPTLLELLGVELLPSYEGQSLLPLLNEEPAAAEAFTQSVAEYHFAVAGSLGTLRTDRWRYVYNPDGTLPLCRPRGGYFHISEQELYDHWVDPEELNNVAAQYPEVTAALNEKLMAATAGQTAKKRSKRADPEVLEQLKELGYITE